MKLRFLLLALATIFVAGNARAQGGAYFNPIVTIVHNSTTDTGPFAFLGENQKQQVFGGMMFGGYYDFYQTPGFKLGLDLRDEIEHGNDAGLNTFLFSPRFTYLPKNSKLKPYVQIGIGAGRTHSPKNPIHITRLESVFLVGVDRPISRHVDWRVFEVGAGTVQTASSSSLAGNSPIIRTPPSSTSAQA